MVYMKTDGLKKVGLGLILISILIGGLGAGTSGRVGAAPDAPQAGSLHNPGFDNHKWYEFNDRYYPKWLPGSWVPDDDVVNGPQSWRLWYMRGKPLVKSFSEGGIVQTGESVVLRTYDGNIQEGGLYQTVYDVAPCLYYTFQMYALSRPDDDVSDKTAVFKVGIDQTGWAPDPASDPAFPGYYPGTIVWGESHDYKYPTFGMLSVSAEAHANKITVFTYAYLYGGTKHAAVWDTGSLVESTPAMLHAPSSLPSPGGVTGVSSALIGGGQAQISWQTAGHPAVSQVYYRLLPQGGAQTNYPHKIYFPLITAYSLNKDWTASPINKTPSETHWVTLSGLLSGRSYEYIAVSRGLDYGQCVTWVSVPQQLTLP